MNITLRIATAADLPAVLSLYRQLGQDDGSVLEPAEAARILQRMREYPDYQLHVAVIDDMVVATFALLIMDNLAHRGAKSAILEDVVVAESRRGQGIGKRMMAHIGELCREKGCYKIALSSNRHRTAAHKFYESLGFELHGYSYALTTHEEEKNDR